MAGIWGGKGQGKTFQCTLAYKKLDINPIVMSAGELESGNAGEPAKLIRQRYREVSFLCPLLSYRPMAAILYALNCMALRYHLSIRALCNGCLLIVGLLACVSALLLLGVGLINQRSDVA